jgi:TetR/AcrR family transcriptional regulator, lmrAB and yxaGH operons repressor
MMIVIAMVPACTMTIIIVNWRDGTDSVAMSSSSRVSMIQSAAVLFGLRGMSATSFADVLEHSGAPRGSIYHHFPGGKRQLATDVIGWTSDQVLGHMRACPPGAGPAEVLAWFVDLWRQSVLASDGCSGCPVAGVAIDAAGAEDDLIEAARAAFADWAAELASQLAQAGLPPDRAGSVAIAALACMEGALILCRAERSSAPLEATARELMNLVPAAG